MATFYPEGRYKCQIDEQGFSSASTGTVQLVLQITVLENESGEPVRNSYQRHIFRAITEKTMDYLLEDLRTLGYHGNSLSPLDPDHHEHVNLRGVVFTAFCKYETNQKGEQQEKWGVARAAGSFDLKPVDSKKLRDLDTLFGRAAKAKPGPKPTAAPPAPWSADPTDDEAPPL